MRALIALAALTLAAADGPGRSLDLTPFATRSAWRLTVAQATDIPDPIMDGSERVPGPLTLCLSRDAGRTCDPQLGGSLRLAGAPDLFDEPHELQRLAVVQPRPGHPLLLIHVASLRSVNGDQRVGLELYTYDRAADRFRGVYRRATRRNNNQELRYIEAGPLRGAVVAAEPTEDAPFGFWITVEQPGADDGYRPVLRYRSVTRYGDGNPLAVIDSDMPALQQRLGVWRPGQPLPLPTQCLAPQLVHLELWCVQPPSR